MDLMGMVVYIQKENSLFGILKQQNLIIIEQKRMEVFM